MNLAQKIASMAKILGRDLNDSAVRIYVQALRNKLTEAEAMSAIDLWFQNAKTSHFPMPAQLIDLVRPQATTDREEATLVATRLNGLAIKRGSDWTSTPTYVDGVPKFMGAVDSYHDSWETAFVEVLGPVALEVVRQMGGWSCVVLAFLESDDAVVRAQIRDLTETVLKRSRMGTLGQNAELPSSDRKQLEAPK